MENFVLKKGELCLFTDRLTRKYLLKVDIAEGYLFVGRDKTVFTDARYFYSAKSDLQKVGVECRLYTSENDLIEFIKSQKTKSLLVDFDKITANEYFSYKKFGVKVKDCSKDLCVLKSVKTEEEILSIRKACKIAEDAYYFAIRRVREGITENELKTILEEKMFSLGAESVSFETIVAFGSNSAVPHHQTGETKLEKDMPILIDFGCKINGYCSDMTRTAFFGKPDKKFTDCYEAVLIANLIAEENIADGITGKTADAFARDYLKDKDLDKFFTHSLGHGLGLEIHEYPRLSKYSDAVLKNQMAFTVEPGVYFDGQFGIRIEDTVILSGGKVERLFTDDKKLLII